MSNHILDPYLLLLPELFPSDFESLYWSSSNYDSDGPEIILNVKVGSDTDDIVLDLL